MKFRLDTAGIFYTPEKAEKLAKLGFRFELDEHKRRGEGTLYKDYEHEVFIEISTLEELLAFSLEWGAVVLSPKDMEIEIYDDYRE